MNEETPFEWHPQLISLKNSIVGIGKLIFPWPFQNPKILRNSIHEQKWTIHFQEFIE